MVTVVTVTNNVSVDLLFHCSMSLGGLKYDPVDDAVDAAVEKGVHFSISAGNDNSDACGKSPAASELRLEQAVTSLSHYHCCAS